MPATNPDGSALAPPLPERVEVVLVRLPRIPEERRVLYALEFLTGMRPGEAAVRRWRDLDRTATPLWRLHVETAWNSHLRREKTTKTLVERVAPVRTRPTEDDLIVSGDRGGPRSNSHSNTQFKADVELLGLRGDRTHYETRTRAMRRTSTGA